jgi:exonuclease VII small subunit
VTDAYKAAVLKYRAAETALKEAHGELQAALTAMNAAIVEEAENPSPAPAPKKASK